ncbi:MAG: copper chaperone PCu(A)C [Betaproteobacteria bacterium]|nr:copper chaperone PCu(A)C [Betaproteobacteria bacterium]
MRKLDLALLLMAFSTLAAADVAVREPWARGTVVGQTASGAFMELTASESAALLEVSSPIAGVVEVHEMSLDNGVMKMRAVPRLDLPAGKSVTLRPGGYHIMLMDLKKQLKKGESVPLTLKIEGKDKKVSSIEVKAEVRELTTPPMLEHKH